MTQAPGSTHDGGPRVTRDQIRDLTTLRRSTSPRMVAGVAEGLARHIDFDPLIIRVVFVVLSVFGGAGIVLYLLAWLCIPEEGQDDSIASRLVRRDPYRVMQVGLVIAAAGAVATMLGAISITAPDPLPVLLISVVAITAFTVFSSRRADAPMAAAGVSEGTTAYGPPPPASAPSSYAAAVGADAQTVVVPVGTEGPAAGSAGGSGSTAYGTPVPSTPPPPPPRPPRSHLFGITMACLAIALGILWVVDETLHDVVPAAYPALALAVIAGGLIAGAWWGRSRLLIVAGLLATVATVAATVVGPGPYGSRIYHPASTSALQASYQLGAGRLVVHLEDLVDPQSLHGRTVRITSHIGQVLVIVPTSIDVAVNAHVDHGNISGLRDVQDLDRGEQRVTAATGAHDLTVDVDLSFGEIDVRRLNCPGQTDATVDSAITTTSTEDANVASACN